MVFDYFMWLGAASVMYGLMSSNIWASLPFAAQAVISLIYFNVAGFFMWCIFVVGHDCGHGTFSDYKWVNDIIGHITHASILVPYYPWQLSHHRHHMYHNHYDKDYSHPWYSAERYEQSDEQFAKYFKERPFLRALFPLVGWFFYLYGLPDGSHFIPYASQRMWAESDNNERVKCIVSSITCMISFACIYILCGSDMSNFLYYYIAPLSVFGWWIVTVTFLQHHNPNTLVYDDSNWKFVDAAFETVDRKYGYGIDTLSHNITDCHVVHHLFFTKIPHYHLKDATKALVDYMDQHGIGSMYRRENTYDFASRVHKYFYNSGFDCTMAAPNTNSKKTK